MKQLVFNEKNKKCKYNSEANNNDCRNIKCSPIRFLGNESGSYKFTLDCLVLM